MFSRLRSLSTLGAFGVLLLSACSQSSTTATCGGEELVCSCPEGQIASATCVDDAVVCDCVDGDAGSDGVDLDSGDQELPGFDADRGDSGGGEETDTDGDATTCPPRPWWTDTDGDGFGTGEPLTTTDCEAPLGYAAAAGDCNDADAFVYPGATEFCDGLDNNCNGQLDERNTVIQQFVDADGDGFGAQRTAPVNNCARLEGYATNADDCDDTNDAINPDAAEACDGVDNNCDNVIDEESAGALWWPDVDEDGYGDADARPSSGCEPTEDAGYVDNGDDCDDGEGAVNPDATEVCNLRDDDCDGSTDEGTPLLVLFVDSDGDTYGDAFAGPRLACEPIAGYVANRDDCNDADDDISPIAAELCNGIDDDCDLIVDNGAIDSPRWYPDVDGDSFGASAGAFRNCSPRGASVLVGGDCDDRDPASYPGAAELCDDRDNNCDSAVDEGVRNACGRCGEPPPEVCGNGIDDDCDGQRDETADGCFCDGRTNQPCYSGPAGTLGVGVCRGAVADCACPGGARFCGDGVWGVCEGEVLPGVELCDGLDNNCDGRVDEGVRNACGDCGPAPVEVCDGIDNNCDGAIDEGLLLACGLCPDAAADLTEVCDNGLDDNCDGRVDEGCSCTGDIVCYPGPPATRGVGLCRDGAVSCYAGSESSGVCAGAVLPGVEICNGEDDNCDGVVDIGPNGCSVCGVDVEICDGVDNDCDGSIDEGVRNSCGACLGDVLPEESGGAALCNGLDDDCDGMIDEGLLNACGTCGETCYTDGRAPSPGDLSDDGATLIGADDPENPTGAPGVTLARETFIPPFVWIANHDFDTVTRFSTETYREEGRYWVGNNPSRTAVDLDGNMWVGGRDDGRLTKILWDTSTCPDRNGNTVIETSRFGALGPLNSGANPFSDECVVYSAVPNAARPSIRGIAAGPDGRVWIGYTDGGVQSIHPYTFELGPFYPGTAVPLWVSDAAGQLTPRLNGDGSPQMTTGGGVYGLVIDSRGQLYISTTNRDRITRFDTNTGQWIAAYTEYQCGSYGIAVDGQNRIWTGGWPRCRGVGMFDPATNRYHNFTIPNGFTMTSGATTTTSTSAAAVCGSPDYCVTGVGVEPATGDVWASFYAAGWTGRLRVDNSNLAASVWTIVPSIRNESTNALLPGVAVDLRGVGFDARGYAWTLGLGSDRLFRIDPATNRRTADLPTGASVGQGSHYTYSDFTGSTTLSFTAPRGFWRSIFDTGFAGAQLDAIDWSGSAPPSTTAELRVRALGADGAPLSSWIPAPLGDGTPVYVAYPTGAASATYTLPVGALVGPRFEVEVRMTTSDPDVRPVITGLTLRWQRP